jgi:hypothetical protein
MLGIKAPTLVERRFSDARKTKIAPKNQHVTKTSVKHDRAHVIQWSQARQPSQVRPTLPQSRSRRYTSDQIHLQTRFNMLSGWTIILISLAYLSLLFAIAYFGDKSSAGKQWASNPVI